MTISRTQVTLFAALLIFGLTQGAIAQQHIGLDGVRVVLDLPDGWTEIKSDFLPDEVYRNASSFSAASSDKRQIVTVFQPDGVHDEATLRNLTNTWVESAIQKGYRVELRGPEQAEQPSDESPKHWRSFLRVQGKDFAGYSLIELIGERAVVVSIGGASNVVEEKDFRMLQRIEWATQ